MNKKIVILIVMIFVVLLVLLASALLMAPRDEKINDEFTDDGIRCSLCGELVADCCWNV